TWATSPTAPASVSSGTRRRCASATCRRRSNSSAASTARAGNWREKLRPLPPTPSPKRRGGARQDSSFLGEGASPHFPLCSPSPLRGGGWGEGLLGQSSARPAAAALVVLELRHLGAGDDVAGVDPRLTFVRAEPLLRPRFRLRQHAQELLGLMQPLLCRGMIALLQRPRRLTLGPTRHL